MRPIKLCGVTMLGLALGIGAAAAQDKTFELKLSHWVPPTHPLQKAIEEWGADIEKASGGTQCDSLSSKVLSCADAAPIPSASPSIINPQSFIGCIRRIASSHLSFSYIPNFSI